MGRILRWGSLQLCQSLVDVLYILLKSVRKLITPQLQDPLSRPFYKYLQFLIYILVDMGWVYQSTNKQKVRQAMVKISKEPYMLAEMADHRRKNNEKLVESYYNY